nr:reverse transcriptase domain-containing protein [Tanacetum cinerariifolium]
MRQETARAYVAAPTENRGYAGNLPRCNRCNLYHNGPCPLNCRKCLRVGHKEKDCKAKTPGAGVTPLQDVVCFGCGDKGHYKNKCPKGRNQQNDGCSPWSMQNSISRAGGKSDKSSGNTSGKSQTIRMS